MGEKQEWDVCAITQLCKRSIFSQDQLRLIPHVRGHSPDKNTQRQRSPAYKGSPLFCGTQKVIWSRSTDTWRVKFPNRMWAEVKAEVQCRKGKHTTAVSQVSTPLQGGLLCCETLCAAYSPSFFFLSYFLRMKKKFSIGIPWAFKSPFYFSKLCVSLFLLWAFSLCYMLLLNELGKSSRDELSDMVAEVWISDTR